MLCSSKKKQHTFKGADDEGIHGVETLKDPAEKEGGERVGGGSVWGGSAGKVGCSSGRGKVNPGSQRVSGFDSGRNNGGKSLRVEQQDLGGLDGGRSASRGGGGNGNSSHFTKLQIPERSHKWQVFSIYVFIKVCHSGQHSYSLIDNHWQAHMSVSGDCVWTRLFSYICWCLGVSHAFRLQRLKPFTFLYQHRKVVVHYIRSGRKPVNNSQNVEAWC